MIVSDSYTKYILLGVCMPLYIMSTPAYQASSILFKKNFRSKSYNKPYVRQNYHLMQQVTIQSSTNSQIQRLIAYSPILTIDLSSLYAPHMNTTTDTAVNNSEQLDYAQEIQNLVINATQYQQQAYNFFEQNNPNQAINQLQSAVDQVEKILSLYTILGNVTMIIKTAINLAMLYEQLAAYCLHQSIGTSIDFLTQAAELLLQNNVTIDTAWQACFDYYQAAQLQIQHNDLPAAIALLIKLTYAYDQLAQCYNSDLDATTIIDVIFQKAQTYLLIANYSMSLAEQSENQNTLHEALSQYSFAALQYIKAAQSFLLQEIL